MGSTGTDTLHIEESYRTSSSIVCPQSPSASCAITECSDPDEERRWRVARSSILAKRSLAKLDAGESFRRNITLVGSGSGTSVLGGLFICTDAPREKLLLCGRFKSRIGASPVLLSVVASLSSPATFGDTAATAEGSGAAISTRYALPPWPP